MRAPFCIAASGRDTAQNGKLAWSEGLQSGALSPCNGNMVDAGRFQHLDALLDRWSERLNPIVVKETRQTLSSRAFPISFLAMLVLCWGLSAAGIASFGERLQHSESGREFFLGYQAALLAAICFVVPTGVFRSVVSEFDGQTFEMLAITALTPRRIVFGKLHAAVVQIGAFYSAAAPFVCFTYMLEGVSIPGILLALFFTFLAGLFSCMGALMFAALAKQSVWQVSCLILAIILDAILFFSGQALGAAAVSDSFGGAGIGGLCLGVGCVGYACLFFSLVTLGVSIAQFTPTLPRAGRIEGERPPALRLGPGGAGMQAFRPETPD